MAETIQVRGEGGGVFTLDLPLHETLIEQLEKGTLSVLDEEGNPVPYEPETASEAEPGSDAEADGPAGPPAAGLPPSGDASAPGAPPLGDPGDTEPGSDASDGSGTTE